MLSILGRAQPNCGGVTRREILRAGAGLLGFSLTDVLRAEAATSAPLPARAKAVIFLYLFGGPSQLETFDPKPQAPDTIRGPFQAIATRTPGLLMGEHLPKLAALSHKFCVVRTLSHNQNDHSTGAHYIQTGHPWHIPIGGGFNATEKDWPAIGSVVEYLDQRDPARRARDIPSYAYVPNRLGHLETYSTRLDRPGQYAGWLGRGYDALATDIRKRDDKDNPYYRACSDEELDFRIKGLAAAPELTLDRIGERKSLLAQFDDARVRAEREDALANYSQFQERAFALVTSERTRTALDIKRETPELRDRYGRHLFGQSTLMARRLVEAGARFVTVCWDAVDGYGWDSHVHSDDVKQHLLPGLDGTLSALIEDLDSRGMLDETLVVAVGEMGRTPKANARWGRDHWSTLFPAVLAGGGIRGGSVHGRTDKDAAFAAEQPTNPESLAATIYRALGIDHELRIADQQGRPVPLVENGEPLWDIFG